MTPQNQITGRIDELPEAASLGDDPLSTLSREAHLYGLKLTSGQRSSQKNRAVGGAPKSYHLEGAGFDFSGDPQKMKEFTEHLRDTYGSSLRELFHDPVGGWKDGQDVGPVGKHSDHVHVAAYPQMTGSLNDLAGDDQGGRVAGLLTDLKATNPQRQPRSVFEATFQQKRARMGQPTEFQQAFKTRRRQMEVPKPSPTLGQQLMSGVERMGGGMMSSVGSAIAGTGKLLHLKPTQELGEGMSRVGEYAKEQGALHGSGELLGNVEEAAGQVLPLLAVPGGAAGIGTVGGVQAYGQGASLPEAIKQGALTGTGVAMGGALASKIPFRGLPGLAARAGVATMGMEAPKVLTTGQLPTAKEVLPNLLLMGGLEAMHGSRGVTRVRGRIEDLPEAPQETAAEASPVIQPSPSLVEPKPPIPDFAAQRSEPPPRMVGPKPEPAKPVAEAAKEPWEMTRKEFDDYWVKTAATELRDEVSSQVPRLETEIERLKAAIARDPHNPGNAQLERAIQEAEKSRGDLLAKLGQQPQRPSGFMTDAQYRLHQGIDEALKEGKPVPPKVLADYPDLAAKYAKPAEAPKAEAGPAEQAQAEAKAAWAKTVEREYAPTFGTTAEAETSLGRNVAEPDKAPKFAPGEAKKVARMSDAELEAYNAKQRAKLSEAVAGPAATPSFEDYYARVGSTYEGGQRARAKADSIEAVRAATAELEAAERTGKSRVVAQAERFLKQAEQRAENAIANKYDEEGIRLAARAAAEQAYRREFPAKAGPAEAPKGVKRVQLEGAQPRELKTKKAKESSSLFDIIKQGGGINLGDAQRGEHRWLREGERGRMPGLFRTKGGMKWDEAHHTLNEYGYNFENVDDLMAAIDAEARGHRQYSSDVLADRALTDKEMGPLEPDLQKAYDLASEHLFDDGKWTKAFDEVTGHDDPAEKAIRAYAEQGKRIGLSDEQLSDILQHERHKQAGGFTTTRWDELFNKATAEKSTRGAVVPPDQTLTTTQIDRVREIEQRLHDSGEPVDKFLKQRGLTLQDELNPAEATLLREMAASRKARRAPVKTEQGAMFETAPTVESKTEAQAREPKPNVNFGLFAGKEELSKPVEPKPEPKRATTKAALAKQQQVDSLLGQLRDFSAQGKKASSAPVIQQLKKLGVDGETIKKAARGESGEAGFLAIGDIASTVHRIAQNARDVVTVDPTPKLARVGVSTEARQHASARLSVPYVVRDLMAKVFPNSYANPEVTARTIDIINKDNILSGYDTFLERAHEARTAGRADEAAQWLARAEAVGDKRDIAALEKEVEAARNDPEISANINRWRLTVNPELDSLYNQMKRVDPNTPREGRGRVFGARINLLPEVKATEMQAFHDMSKPMPEGSTSNFRNPNVKRDPFMRAAKFTGEYSTDAEAVLTNVLGPRLNETTKLKFYDALIDKGVAIEAEPGEPTPLNIQGQKPTRLSVKIPQTGADGRTSIVEKSLWIRPDLVREARAVLNTDMPLPSNPVFKLLTQIQLAQLTDMTAHLKNVHTVLAGALGTKSAFRDAVKRLPVLGSIDSIARITSVAKEIVSDSPAIRSELAEMSKLGLIRPDYPVTGIQKLTRGQQLIHGVDTASRVVMNRFFDNLAERGLAENTPKNRADFVQQIGEYNRRLMGPWMRGMRDYGLSPFVVAGRTFNRQGRRLLTGAPGVKATSVGAAAQMRAVNLTSGLVAATVLPAILNYVSTGSIGGRPGTPIGAWDLGKPEDEQGKHKVIDLMQILGIRRGLRATGLGAAIEGFREGQTKNEIAGHAIQDVITTASHPWMGPGLGAAYQTLTGRRLDLRGGPEPPAAENVGGGKQYLENARTALQTQNPLLYGIASPVIGTEAENASDPYWKRIGKGMVKAPSSSVGIQDLSSPAEKMLRELSQQRGASPPTAQQRAISNIISAYKTGGDFLGKFEEAKKAGILTDKDKSTIVARIKDPHLVRGFRSLPFEDALRVYEMASPIERDDLKDLLIKKFDVSKIPPQRLNKVIERIRALN